jgi:nitrite reductase/ring-hydroxylating ferredoxin subunit
MPARRHRRAWQPRFSHRQRRRDARDLRGARGRAVAYENSCPHLGSPLDWVPDQFLDLEKRHILCATHGALFRISDGHCLAGPCVGKSLKPVPIRIDRGSIYLGGDAP